MRTEYLPYIDYGLFMKKVFFLITLFILFFKAVLLPVSAEGEPVKVMSLNYDNSSSLVYITTKDTNSADGVAQPLKYVGLSNPNRIYFDINNAVLIGEKQQLVFEKSPIKEIRLAQFETNPNIVRTVITFEEDFDTSKIKLVTVDGNIIVKVLPPAINNDYFNLIYDESAQKQEYSGINVNSQFIKKITVPVQETSESKDSVIGDIQQAFGESTLQNSDGKTYDEVMSVEISSGLKLRTKYYINQYIPKNNGLLVSGVGQISAAKMFYLTSPDRAVIDLPNTYLSRSVRNKEVNLCPDGTCEDVAKLGQFDFCTARIVITSNNADKYMPIYSQDSQSLFVVNPDKLNHTALTSVVSNINKAFVRRLITEQMN